MTALEHTPPTSSAPSAASAASAAALGSPVTSALAPAVPTVTVATPGVTPVAAVPPVVVTPAGAGSSTTTVVYVNPPAVNLPAVNPAAQAAVDAGFPRPSRKGASLLTAYALFFFFGWTGMHQVYLGNTLRGVSYIFTFSWLTLGLWIDLFTLPSQVRRVNTERLLGLR